MAASDDDEIPETGAIFTFGKTRFAENLANKFWIRDDKVLHLACGDEHSAVITNTGRLYTFGSNDWGQLGHGNNKPYTKPGVVKKLKGDKVKFVACGRSHTLVISESGVYSFGAGADSQLGHGDNQSCNVPTQIEALENKRISKVACGAEHSAALTENGELYTWGSGSEGQLGLGLPDSELPTKLKLQEQIIDVACGYYHTAIVTDDGKLFTFGDDEGGKLGLDDDQCNDTEEPQHVRTISEHVVSVACGGNHTAAVTSRGTLYTFGNGMHGQLGHGPQQLEAPLPTPVAALRRKCVTGVACGESHTAAFTKAGELYTCGDGRHGKLGMGDDSFSNLFKPEKVVRFKSFHVVYVACGGCHMLVVATRNTQDDRDSEGSEEEEDDVVQTSPVKDKNQDQWGAKDVVDGPKPPPRLSSTLPLSASMSARDKRRQKDMENTMLTGSLPPLNRSSLPPLASLGLSNVKKEDTSAKPAANGGFNPLDKSTLPTISLKEPSPDENNDSHEEQQPAAKPSSARRLPPRPKKRQKKPVQTPHSDSDEDEEHNTSRSDASSPTRRPKPLPRKQKGNKTQNKEASLAENSKKSPAKMPAGRSAGSEASDEDSGDDERSYRSSPGKNGDGPGTSRSLAETKKSEKIAVDHEKMKDKEEDSEEEDDSEEDEVEEIVNDGKEKSKDGKKEEEKEDEDEDEDSEDDEEEDSTKDSKASSASKKSETKVEQEDSGEEDVKDKDKKKKGKDKEKRKKNEESENEDTKEDDGKTKKKDKKKDKTKGKKEDDRDDDDEEQTNNNKSGKNKKKQKGKKKAESEEEDDDDEEGQETEETENKKDEKKDDDKENEKEENVDGKTEEEGNKKDEKTDGKKSKKSGVCVLL